MGNPAMVGQAHPTNTAARSGRAIVVFRNDDPSAMSDVEHEKRVAAIFEKYGVPQVLGVIPNCCEEGFREIRGTRNRPLASNPGMVDFLRQYAASSGSEIALHGYTHRTNRLSIPARREFFEFRDVGLSEQLAWMRAGTEMIESALGVRPTTFIPPWNRLDTDTLVACEQCGYKIVSAGAWTPTRPGLLSLGTDCDLADFPRRLEKAIAGGNRVLIRVLFHSLTTRSQAELDQLENAVRLAANTPACRVLTLQQVAEQFGDLSRKANGLAELIVDQTERVGTAAARATLYERAYGKLVPIPAWLRKIAVLRNEWGRYDDDAFRKVMSKRPQRVLLLSRMSIVVIPLVLASLFDKFAGGVFSPLSRAILLGLAGAVVVLGGIIASRLATSPDTRRESLLAMFLCLLGLALPLALVALKPASHG